MARKYTKEQIESMTEQDLRVALVKLDIEQDTISAKIADYETQIKDKDNAINKLKIDIYDLNMSIPDSKQENITTNNSDDEKSLDELVNEFWEEKK